MFIFEGDDKELKINHEIVTTTKCFYLLIYLILYLEIYKTLPGIKLKIIINVVNSFFVDKNNFYRHFIQIKF